MATDWIMVRIDKATHAALERVRQSMLLAEEMGLRTTTRDNRDRFSLNQVIGHLVAFRDKHAARVRRSKAKRKVKATAALPDQVNGPSSSSDQSSNPPPAP